MPSGVSSYRRLPGKWRGIFTRASIFAAGDHLLSVSATRFEERYRRLYFRDIRAIVVGKAVRFGVPVLLVWSAFLAVILLGFAYTMRLDLGRQLLWLVLAGIAAFWLYECFIDGVRCRVYTGVSQLDVPAIRRSSDARRFLAEVNPLIESVQGPLPENWRETVAAQDIAVNVPAAFADWSLEQPGARQLRTIASDALLVALVVDAAVTGSGLLLALALPSWASAIVSLAEAVAAVWVLVQYRRRLLRKRTMWTAVAVLVLVGISLQGQNFLNTFEAARHGRSLGSAEMIASQFLRTFRFVYFVACLVLAVTLTLFSAGEPDRLPQPERPQ